LRADAVFDFNSVPIGTATPFSVTVNGLTATFSSPADPGGFEVTSGFGLFAPPLNGNVLLDPGPSGASGIPLDISFSQNLSTLTVDFATEALGSFGITANEGTVGQGEVGSSGTIPTGFTFPQGTVSFHGGPFNNVVLTTSFSPPPYFAIEDLTAVVAVVVSTPEPSSFYLSAPILAALFGALRFSRKRRTAA
jgi:hypothetical protein